MLLDFSTTATSHGSTNDRQRITEHRRPYALYLYGFYKDANQTSPAQHGLPQIGADPMLHPLARCEDNLSSSTSQYDGYRRPKKRCNRVIQPPCKLLFGNPDNASLDRNKWWAHRCRFRNNLWHLIPRLLDASKTVCSRLNFSAVQPHRVAPMHLPRGTVTSSSKTKSPYPLE